MNRKPLMQGDKIELEGNTIEIDGEVGRGVSSVAYTGKIEQKGDSLPVSVIVKEFYPNKGFERIGTQLKKVSEEYLSDKFRNLLELFRLGYRKQNDLSNSNRMEIAVRPYLYGRYGDSEYYVSDVHMGTSLEHVQFTTLKEKLDCMIRIAEVFGILHDDEENPDKWKYVMLDFSPSNILWIEKPKGVRILDADSIVSYLDICSSTDHSYNLKLTGIGDNKYTSPGIRQLKVNVESGSSLKNALSHYARPQENVYSLGCFFYELLLSTSEDICEMNFEDFCRKLFAAYKAEIGSISNAEALLKVVWRAVRPEFSKRQENGRILQQELIAVSKKINAFEYIPKKTIIQANATFLAYNLLEEYPLFDYISEKDERKLIHVAITGTHRLRDELFSAVLCMQMLDTDMFVQVVAEDAEDFWNRYLRANPAVLYAVTWSLNGVMQPNTVDQTLVTEKLAHIDLITKKADESLAGTLLESAKYIVLLEETIHDRKERLNRLLRGLGRRKKKEKVFISYIQNSHSDAEIEKMICSDEKMILLHRINCYKFSEEYNEEIFARKISRMALYAHAYYKGCMSENGTVNLTELEKELQDNPYYLEASQRTGLHSLYKLASVGIQGDSLGKYFRYNSQLQDKQILERLAWLEHRSWEAFLITKGGVPLTFEEFQQIAYHNGNTWKDVTDAQHMKHPLLVASSVDTEQIFHKNRSIWDAIWDAEIERMDPLDQRSYKIARWYWENKSEFQSVLTEDIRELNDLLNYNRNDVSAEKLTELIEVLKKQGEDAIEHIGERMSMQDQGYVKKWKNTLQQVKIHCKDNKLYEDILQKLEQDMKPVVDSYSERDFKQLDRDLVYAVMDLLAI